eukprot:4907506-Pyramimonas_sp.AAC.1
MLEPTFSSAWISADKSALMLPFAVFSSSVSGMFDISTMTVTRGSVDWPAFRWDSSSAVVGSSAGVATSSSGSGARGAGRLVGVRGIRGI